MKQEGKTPPPKLETEETTFQQFLATTNSKLTVPLTTKAAKDKVDLIIKIVLQLV